MSVQALSAVFDLPGFAVTPSERLVLLSIANHANRFGKESYPGWNTIAEETGLARATVARCISTLRQAGHLSVQRGQARGRDGKWEVTVYSLRVPGLSTESQDETPTVSHVETSPESQRGLKRGLTDDTGNQEPEKPSDAALSEAIVQRCFGGRHDFAVVGDWAVCRRDSCRLRVSADLAHMALVPDVEGTAV